MMKVAICDDEIEITGSIERKLQSIANKNFINMNTEVFWDGYNLIEAIKNNACFDIIFLDIEMDGEDGITVAKQIRKIDKRVLIVYATSHENYMKASFDVRPFRFMVKPIEQEELERCLLAAQDDINNEDSYFRYNYQRVHHKIVIGDILYFESDKRKIHITTDKDRYELYGKLDDIEVYLKKCKVNFLRVHQSFLVNYKHIECLGYDFVILDNKKRISISEERRKRIGEQYCAIEGEEYVRK